jgi:hypothetical protein
MAAPKKIDAVIKASSPNMRHSPVSRHHTPSVCKRKLHYPARARPSSRSTLPPTCDTPVSPTVISCAAAIVDDLNFWTK